MNDNILNHTSKLQMRRSQIAAFLRFPDLVDSRRWLRVLKWLIPLAMVILVAFYEFGLSIFLTRTWEIDSHTILDTVVYGSIGPILAFTLLNFLDWWLAERETSDLQAKILEQARADTRHSRQLADDAVQVLFSASALIDTLKECQPNWPADSSAQVEITEKALAKAIQDLRSHLTE